MKFWKRLRRQSNFEADLAEEIRIHREMAEEWELGHSRQFGSVALTLEDSRAVWRFRWLDSLAQDVRFALRGFRKSPGFALAVIGTIGAALGLNTTVFTVINAYALRPLTVRDPYSLYRFTYITKAGGGHSFSTAEYRALAQNHDVFSDVFAYRNFLGSVDGRAMLGEPVSENYFNMLGVGMFQGRPLLPGDTAAMVVSHEAWRNKFGSDPALVGRKVYLRGHPFEVVGIAASTFSGMESFPAAFWIPVNMLTAVMQDVGDKLWVIGRLRPGVRPEAAQSALLAWSKALVGDVPQEDRPFRTVLEPRATAVPISKEAVAALIPIFVIFGLVLLIACANVSNMMLARALSRQREIGIRISLGAGRARLVRQFLTESVLLAVPAALAGLAISDVTVRAAKWLMFETVPPAFARMLTIADLSPDWRVFGFILGGAFAATLVFGLIPAIQTTRSSIVSANRGDFGNDLRPQRLRNILVVAQVAVCALLLVMSVVVVRTRQRVTDVNIGLSVHTVYDIKMVSKYQAAVSARLFAEPDVAAVAAAWRAPLYGSLRQLAIVPAGRTETVTAGYNFVSPGYFDVFQIPLVKGRSFTREEAEADASVVVVSESTARRLWPDREAVGQSFTIPWKRTGDPYFDRRPSHTDATVIGVAHDVMNGMIVNGPETDAIYFPNSVRWLHNDSLLVRMRTAGPESRRHLETALNQVAPSLADAINSMDDVLALQVYPFRVIFWITGFLGCFALALTVSGIYGVMSYLVSQRTKEIGIRVALGASARDVIEMVVRQSTRLACIGAALGIGMALAVAPLVANQIEILKPYDAVAYAAGGTLVVLAALAASWQPVRRAVSIDPVRALKSD